MSGKSDLQPICTDVCVARACCISHSINYSPGKRSKPSSQNRPINRSKTAVVFWASDSAVDLGFKAPCFMGVLKHKEVTWCSDTCVGETKTPNTL